MPQARDNYGVLSPEARSFITRWLSPLVRVWFRPTIEGLEHLPPGPCMIVANHSAGIAAAELTSLATLITAELPDARIAGFAHTFGFRLPGLRWVHRHLGSAPSTYEGAYAALDAGAKLLVFPGGDHEALRPITQAHRVDFAGRKGFLKIARERGLPIVPMGIRGAAFTSPVLLRARWLAWLMVGPRLLGVKRGGVTAVGLLGAACAAFLPLSVGARALLAWAWMASPMAFAPVVPATVRFSMGAPIAPEELFHDASDVELGAAYERVVSEVQARVDGLARRARTSDV